MADKNSKKKVYAPITNPQLDAAIAELKKGNGEEQQKALNEALKSARLLSPCDFDVDIQQQKDGTIKNVHPSQIKFYLLNTNDGKTFFPVFTDMEKSTHFQFGKDIKPKEVVRSIADFDRLLQDPNGKAQGIVINPGIDNVVIPKRLIGILSGRKEAPVPQRPNPAAGAPLNVRYTEPAVYPTKMVNAIYDKCAKNPEISRVWLKNKIIGHVVSFYIVVEADEQNEHLLNEIREAAVPLAKDVQVEVVFANEKIMKDIIREAVALYDRNLEL